MTEQIGEKPVDPLKGAQMFLVRDGFSNIVEYRDTLPEAVELAETLVEEHRDVAADGWPGGDYIDVLQVLRRWTLFPVPTPEDEEGDWADLKEAELPSVDSADAEPRFGLAEIEQRVVEAIYMTAVDRGHGLEPPMVTEEIERFKGHLKQLLQDSRKGGEPE